MKLFDSHAHLTSDQIFPEVDDVLERARAHGVDKIVNICTCDVTLKRGLALRNKYDWVYNVASTTPHDVVADGERLFPFMSEHARNGDLVAVGETGLDYYYHDETKELQQHFLRKYFTLALETKLPIVIHCRDAFDDFFQILDDAYFVEGFHAPGVLHCFTGTLTDAHDVVSRGWYLSLSGIVTFKQSHEMREVAKMVPLHQLLIETDTPYLAPQAYRGKRNEPAYLMETAKMIADLRAIPLEQLIEATYQNACRFFNVKEESAS